MFICLILHVCISEDEAELAYVIFEALPEYGVIWDGFKSVSRIGPWACAEVIMYRGQLEAKAYSKQSP